MVARSSLFAHTKHTLTITARTSYNARLRALRLATANAPQLLLLHHRLRCSTCLARAGVRCRCLPAPWRELDEREADAHSIDACIAAAVTLRFVKGQRLVCAACRSRRTEAQDPRPARQAASAL